MAQIDFDAAIIGGGPAGSSAASYLAKAGLKCVVLERELFPRQHVGESLVPASNRVLAEIGFIDQMDQHFVRKFGAVWTSSHQAPTYRHNWMGLDGDPGRADIRFEERQQEGVTQNYTWHVDRGVFDLMLLQHANKLGATVYEGVRAQGVDFSDPAAPRVKFSLGRQEMAVSARVVLDATGRHTLLGNQLRFKQQDPVFNQYAIHSWFDNFDRMVAAHKENLKDYIFVHFLPISNSWIWQIPITETITSVGVVTQRKNFEKSRESRERFFWQALQTRPELYEALKAADQLRPFKEEGDYSYNMKQICGDGFALVGDAGRFVDPIFSSGVSIALNSSRLATRDIIAGLNNGGCQKAAFNTFETLMRRGTRNWYEFISVYYRLNVLFTYFIEDPRYRLQVLKLLQGDMYDEERPAVLAEMIRRVEDIERRPGHPWHKLLGDLAGDVFEPLY
jgi:1H-pyrrole-2-carbonyl-[peptidyl-carrier protein] chlorinase